MDSKDARRALKEDHGPDSWLLVGFLVGAAVLAAIIFLANEIMEGDHFGFDEKILLSLRKAGALGDPTAPQWMTEAMIDITALGGVTVLTLVTLFAVGYLLAIGRHKAALFVSVSIGLGALATKLAKGIVLRERPDVVPHLVPVDTLSFPSGHSLNSALVYLTLAALVARTRTHMGVRLYLMGAALGLTFLIGFSRLYLGVHWPTDVLAGWGLGALWAAASSLVAKLFQREGKVEPPSEGEEVEE
ncbi:phosphatase PAP2 family protein [Sphingomicrobium arenosum]|uniref:phosphatase PAP2 family protein n=1 Tax=Sphingomicrobium arenosum TaxID=2233861 RepID=UPI00223E9327|nr:phosphatase PAP2 family protein [Sphingomicrobium arenosum]